MKSKIEIPVSSESCGGECGNGTGTPAHKAGVLVALCFELRNKAHIAHLQAKGPGSYATHKALDTFYNEIIEHADAYAENYQGRYGIIETYPMKEVSIESTGQPIGAMIDALRSWIDQNRGHCGPESELQNLIDNIVELCNSTLYKLRNLR